MKMKVTCGLELENNVDRTEGHKPIPISSLTLLATLRRPHLAGLDDDEPIIRNLFSRARGPPGGFQILLHYCSWEGLRWNESGSE